MKFIKLFFLSGFIVLTSCKNQESSTLEITSETTNDYLDYSNRDDQFTGGIKMIPIITAAKDTFNVWTKRVGNNPTKKVLLLHGGPGVTHEIYESFDGYFPNEGIEYYYYDQLGSYYSDKPEEGDTSLWTIDHFVEEVEQVRKALDLDKDNFYLFGQSWGGILAMEYAFKYQEHLKGLIISNMMSSVPEYNQYAKEVLGPAMDPEIFKEIQELEAKEDFENPRYTELLFKYHYPEHVLRMPPKEWPESVNRAFNHINPSVYIFMQGYSEFRISGDASLKEWDVKDQLKNINAPTLVIGAQHDTMDPKHMEWMANEVQNGRFLLCPNGSHLSQYDDQKNFFNGLSSFIHDVDSGDF